MNRRWHGRKVIPALVLTLCLSLGGAACGDDDDDGTGDGHTATGEVVAMAGDIEIIDPYVRETVNDVAALYMSLQSAGLEDTLVSTSASVGTEWQIHEAVVENGSGSMQQVEGGVLVPAGEHVHFEPGGYHVMLMGLTQPLEPGDEIEVELTFASGETASFTAPVRALDDESGEEHSEQE